MIITIITDAITIIRYIIHTSISENVNTSVYNTQVERSKTVASVAEVRKLKADPGFEGQWRGSTLKPDQPQDVLFI